ncbi:polysaccharide deacetylase family protein [Alistipes sp. OttesenSCG-928-B03]|nr:polysaccharide deacetylase family protein [Alistipes sp. OttesenSCG-928-B03]
MRITPPRFLKKLMPALVWNMDGEQDVFITFDDGPTPGITEWIIDTLARYDAKATFFCLGKNVEQHPDVFRKIIEAGHATGNHTYSHQKGWRMSTERYVEDVDFAAQLIPGDLFRPPYGRIKPAQARVLGERYHLIMWDVLSRDYSSLITPRQCTRNVLKHVRAGSVVVFHDSRKSSRNMRYALPRVLDYIYNEKGLKCSPIIL